MIRRLRTASAFFSYAPADAPTARRLAAALEESGFDVQDATVMVRGAAVEEKMREALATSNAVVILVPGEGGLSDYMYFWIGAADAWGKSIFFVVPDEAFSRVPSVARKHQVIPLSRIDDLIRAIDKTSEGLSQQEVDELTKAYQGLGVSMDALLQSPELVDQLAERFKNATRRKIPEYHLLAELMRLRKRGALPRRTARRAPG